MKKSAIVAISKNRVIGKNNRMPWHLPNDLKYFKKITSGHPVIMGRKNFIALGKPLPNRLNIVITRDKSFKAKGCIIVHSIDEAIEKAINVADSVNEIFVIGGGEIYRQFMNRLDVLYITEIDIEVDGDVFFPEIDTKKWRLISAAYHVSNKKNPYHYTFKIYERK